MATIIFSLIVVALSIGGMAIGLILKNKPLCLAAEASTLKKEIPARFVERLKINFSYSKIDS